MIKRVLNKMKGTILNEKIKMNEDFYLYLGLACFFDGAFLLFKTINKF